MSNQTKPAPPKIVVAPEGCESYLTAGKEYDVFIHEYTGTQYYFEIIDDKGHVICCLENNDGHAGYNNWIIKEREVSHD